jgi:hypothetical protein
MGSQKMVYITYLRSYEGFGSSNLITKCENGNSQQFLLNGHHLLHQSTEHIFKFFLNFCAPDEDLELLFQFQPHKDFTKFKIIRLSTC